MGNTMSELTLRAASAADVSALSRLAIDSFVAKFGHMYRAEDLSAFLGEVLSEPAIAAEVANPDRIYRLVCHWKTPRHGDVEKEIQRGRR